ncbi:succinate dehydrogenase / fumarate reductase cytochrome b subunit [Rhodoblastus acidophilus]|uniref:succinate dehydrogenase, cytochrome b556 subunit n=1 Tax=Rhodoblastus acidophilus TaxID=1074 RepID=UPI001620B6DC|nr:succinate dehydrogenase, cytochrome b556 subunit [Rhodoblastus acidophilus]MCW2285280.1 succinate dehydrogenase / fumarate reductase cytochrome b subunit [Rhodoblastus acidophilus]MCW2334236.1 succinate dehydrogenase / fumarate reductase cytochrome b subunit [Rhodoblastus acidophilus]
MAEAKSSPLPIAQRRPLSPHVQIYRWSATMAMSILHRVTGVALYLGTILLTVYLFTAASGGVAFAEVSRFFGSPLGLVILFGYTFALMLHVCGGLRHAVWEAARGFDPVSRSLLAWGSLIGAVILTALAWAGAFLL